MSYNPPSGSERHAKAILAAISRLTEHEPISQFEHSSFGLMKLTVYEYSGCSTCRKALKFLDAAGVSYEKRPIVEQPPTPEELRRMIEYLGGDFKRLFNTSGQLYREMKIGDRVRAGMTEAGAIALLSRHGKLIKRPFALAADRGVVGFRESEWEKLISTERDSGEGRLP